MTFVGLLGDMSLHQSVIESASKTPGLTTCFPYFVCFVVKTVGIVTPKA